MRGPEGVEPENRRGVLVRNNHERLVRETRGCERRSNRLVGVFTDTTGAIAAVSTSTSIRRFLEAKRAGIGRRDFVAEPVISNRACP